MQAYESPLEAQMRKFYATLSEKDKRRYAAVEAMKLGHGGIGYIAALLGCSIKTISRGIKEVTELPEDIGYDKRRRGVGGGRKPHSESIAGLAEKFLEVLKDHTAGDPMNEAVVWTNLTPKEIRERLVEDQGLKVSLPVIRKLLKKHNYRRRKAQKKNVMKSVEDKEKQFENIASLKSEYQACGNPVLSMDTKKKEYLGNYWREGCLYTQEVILTHDHDFNSFSEGIVIPHGIYDLTQNRGYIHLGTSKDTSQFACDCLRNWWYRYGQYAYSTSSSILILCDCGGSNNARHYIFKEDLQSLAKEIRKELRIAHYPPYNSKYNPIEHRLFPHITRACQGVVFKSLDLVKELMLKAKTTTGLKVEVEILDKIYQTGRKVAAEFKETMKIVFEDYLPQWNYTAIPR